MTDNDNTLEQPPAGASIDDKPLLEIPVTTTLADVVQLVRETYHALSNRQDKADKQLAAFIDKSNRPKRRSNSRSSSGSDISDRDIFRTNNHPRQTPIRTSKLPTPNPQTKTPIAQIPSPLPQTFTPVLQSRNPVQLPRPRVATDVDQHITPSLSPKDYLQSIPYFDGTPMCYDASEFIIHCKNALAYIPRYQEYEILALLTGRLKGEALRRAYKSKLRTVNDLINFIKESFDKPKTYFSLRNQILKLEQGTHESMNTYIARAQELLSDCTECLLTSNVPNKESAKQTLNDDVTNGFVHGTLKKYLRLFATKNFPNFAAACAEGRRAEGELAEYPQLDDTNTTRKDCFFLQTTNSVEANNNTNNNYRPICTFCQKPGHTIDICFKRTAQTNNQNSLLQQNSNIRNYNNPNIQICNYCQKPGHTIDICYKLKALENNQRTANQQNPNTTNPNNFITQICDYCQKPGHTIDVCFKRKAQTNNQNFTPQQHSNLTNPYNSNMQTISIESY
ncbi:hypothetical protein PV325_011590 [Microctonus aethiopoides]|nr:hypothetical protein PV325_011590 [Microctonus aethiopoides]